MMKIMFSFVALMAVWANVVAGEQFVHGPFKLETDGFGMKIRFEDQVIIAGDGTGRVPGPPGDAHWKIEKTAATLTATFAYPRVTKRVVLRQTDCFVEFGLTGGGSGGGGKGMYLVKIPRSVFAGRRLYNSERGSVKASWANSKEDLKWRDREVLGVVRDGRRFEFQHALSRWKNRSVFEVTGETKAFCRWRTEFRDIGRNQTEWTVYRFTADPKTPLPPETDHPLYPEFGNLIRDQVSLATAGYAISLLRSTRAVFRGRTMKIDARYVDHFGPGRRIKYSYRVSDWRGREVSRGTGEFVTDKTGTLVYRIAELRCGRVGCFKFDFEAVVRQGPRRVVRGAFRWESRRPVADTSCPHVGADLGTTPRHRGHLRGPLGIPRASARSLRAGRADNPEAL